MRDKSAHREKFKAMFHALDTDESGDITLDELVERMHDENVQAYLAHLDIRPSNTWQMFKLLEADGSGTVSIEEFVDGCMRLRGPAQAADVASITIDLEKQGEKLSEFMTYTEASFV